ncbi:MAG: cupin domain-containing protein [Planctomycetota bacterium]
MIRNIDDVEMAAVAMNGVKDASMAVMVGRDDGAPNFAMRSFSVEAEGHTPQHAHDYEHEVFIVAGGGTVLLGDTRHEVRPGDVIYIRADLEHQFRAGDQGLRFLCLVPVERNCGDPTPGS